MDGVMIRLAAERESRSGAGDADRRASRPTSLAWSTWFTSSWKRCSLCGQRITFLADQHHGVIATVCLRCDLPEGGPVNPMPGTMVDLDGPTDGDRGEH
jgi:hypothetical protein